jgi:hypothetical protein
MGLIKFTGTKKRCFYMTKNIRQFTEWRSILIPLEKNILECTYFLYIQCYVVLTEEKGVCKKKILCKNGVSHGGCNRLWSTTWSSERTSKDGTASFSFWQLIQFKWIKRKLQLRLLIRTHISSIFCCKHLVGLYTTKNLSEDGNFHLFLAKK